MNKYKELLDEWQERLGLQDWAIVLYYNCKPDDMKLNGVNAETEWVVSIKNASIKMLKPKYDDTGTLKYDIEQTLVHELLHLKFAIIDVVYDDYNGTIVDELRHQIIDDLARALVMAKRKKTKRELNCDKVNNRNENRKD